MLKYGVPDFGAPDFRAPGFGVLLSLEFLVSEFPRSGAPTSQLTSLIVQGGSGGGRHYKNNGFRIPEVKSFGFSWFQLCVPEFRSS